MRSSLGSVSENEEEQLFEISAVSRLTGVSTPNIRVWERRYQVVEPRRTPTKRRLYTQADIQRLVLLKALVDGGHTISTIASLATPQLEARLRQQSDDSVIARGEGKSCRLLIVGETLTELLSQTSAKIPGTSIIASFGTLDEAEEWGAAEADAVVVECATLFKDTVSAVQGLIKRTGALRALIVYRFAQSNALTLVERGLSGVTALRGPVNVEELRVMLQADVSLAAQQPALGPISKPSNESVKVPKRRFTDKQLAAASQVSTVVDCECPQHLANLLTSLAAFEQYSAECESRNAEDEALHRFLHETTAQTRSMMEEALQRVIEVEGIEL